MQQAIGNVHTECPVCGPVLLPAQETVVAVRTSGYSFTCPSCGKSVLQRVGRNVIKFLLATGSSVGPRGPIAAT